MGISSVVIIAIGLAMDAFTVAVTSGIIIKNDIKRNAFRVGLYFGLFQAIMPLIGWFIGLQFKEYITMIDHWIAFGLLGFLGLKMIYESFKEEESKDFNPSDNKTLIILAIATSIDALIVGITFAFMEISIVTAVTIIGVITFILSYAGVYIGRYFGQLLNRKAELLGGIILIIIGIKIVVEHTNLLYVFQ